MDEKIDPEDKKDQFKFTPEGEAMGYIDVDQAKVLARRFLTDIIPNTRQIKKRRLPHELDIGMTTETEDNYIVSVTFSATDAKSVRGGVAEIYVTKEGGIDHHEFKQFPRYHGLGSRLPIYLAAGIAFIGGVSALAIGISGVGSSNSQNQNVTVVRSLETAVDQQSVQAEPTATLIDPTQEPTLDAMVEGDDNPPLTPGENLRNQLYEADRKLALALDQYIDGKLGFDYIKTDANYRLVSNPDLELVARIYGTRGSPYGEAQELDGAFNERNRIATELSDLEANLGHKIFTKTEQQLKEELDEACVDYELNWGLFQDAFDRDWPKYISTDAKNKPNGNPDLELIRTIFPGGEKPSYKFEAARNLTKSIVEIEKLEAELEAFGQYNPTSKKLPHKDLSHNSPTAHLFGNDSLQKTQERDYSNKQQAKMTQYSTRMVA